MLILVKPEEIAGLSGSDEDSSLIVKLDSVFLAGVDRGFVARKIVENIFGGAGESWVKHQILVGFQEGPLRDRISLLGPFVGTEVAAASS